MLVKTKTICPKNYLGGQGGSLILVPQAKAALRHYVFDRTSNICMKICKRKCFER
ncbi:MAG: hypothetical protein ACE5LX_05455 [Nitrospinota bacterium]